VKYSKTAKSPLTCVNSNGTSKEFLTSVSDTSNVCFANINDTGEAPK
jgi:hypothetical protein